MLLLCGQRRNEYVIASSLPRNSRMLAAASQSRRTMAASKLADWESGDQGRADANSQTS